MTIYELYDQLKTAFLALSGVMDLLQKQICITADKGPEKTLVPEEDRPSPICRPEYRVTAYFEEFRGEAYTETPADFSGTLEELLQIPSSENGIDARVIAGINAVMSCLGLCTGVFPDNEDQHKQYAKKLCDHVTAQYGKSRIVLVGYDGYIVKQFIEEGLDFWTLDRNPEHITKDRFGHVIVNGAKYNRESSFVWGKVLLVTGSSLCNGTIIPYLNSGKTLLFYGITISGAASLLKLPWFPVD